jgi:hypothetical protein
VIFPENIIGPKFSEGDIVTYTFDDAKLAMRLPVIPHNTDTIDRVSSIRDLRNIDTSDWTHYGDEGYCYEKVVVQDWKYEDMVTHDDIAYCLMTVTLQKHSESEAATLFGLNSKSFREQQLQWFSEDHNPNEHEGDPAWPCPENDFFAKTIEMDLVNGLLVQIETVIGGGPQYPDLYALLSLGKHFAMGIKFSLQSLHYSDRTNPFSDELLESFKLKLFDDFLSYIRIDYNDETTAIIEGLKSEAG